MKAHPAGTLDDGLDDHRRQLVGVAGKQLDHMLCPRLVERSIEAVGGALGEDVLGKHAAEHRVHPADRVADRHRAERVAVVAAADREQASALGMADRALVLQSHLDRHLHRHRAGVGEEHVLQAIRRDLHQPLGKLHSRLMRQTTEHHVSHALQLLAHCRVQRRMAIAVDRTPPRGHAVDQLAPIGQAQTHALGGDHRQRR